jgi:hypothetical protein
MRVVYWQSEGWPKKNGSSQCADLSVPEAKRLLKKKGGTAFTAFFDRKCELLRTEKIELKGGATKEAAV